MDERSKIYLNSFLSKSFPKVLDSKPDLAEEFISNAKYLEMAARIIEFQEEISKDFKMRMRVNEIMDTRLVLPNAKQGKEYQFYIDFDELDWNDIVYSELEGLESTGLEYLVRERTLKGIPSVNGDISLIFRFKLKGEKPNKESLNEKSLRLIINPDPKLLWKNIASDQEGAFSKVDNASSLLKLAEKNIVVASKRGRSHANVGSYRDDDYAISFFENSGWTVVAVADGAGSAELSRMGSKIACDTVVKYFAESLKGKEFETFESVFTDLKEEEIERPEADRIIKKYAQTELGKAAFKVHQELIDFSKTAECDLKSLNTTLIFSLFKKFKVGYSVLTFGVGDCPIILLDKEFKKVDLLNYMDVGEFGGGTRFITMPEIFNPIEDFYSTRFNFKLVPDFSYLLLMTDGIYDPKFEVEANLEKIDKWEAFFDDLNGKNEDEKSVNFSRDNKDADKELSDWMNFWSVGNHDDRTLAIIY